MKFKLPDLAYSFNALEPFLSEETVRTHYTKHHQHYIDKTNELIVGTPFESLEQLDELVMESHRKKRDHEVFDNASQAWNHGFYWNCLTPGQKHPPSAKMTEILTESFGTYKDFHDEFTQNALKLFGSGWVWLTKDDDDGRLEIIPLKDGDSPLVYEKTPLLAIDVWEHAYYLDYKNERNKYIENFWKLVDWRFVENSYNQNFINPEGKALLNKEILDHLSGSLRPNFF